MKAMILAAGLGTRLKPFTQTMPKALVPVAGVPMIELLIRHLQEAGIVDLIINVHHYAGMVIDFLKQNNNFGSNITISNEEELLLDTGGGLKKAAWFFNDHQPFLVQNVDVLSDINYSKMIGYHKNRGGLATLAVSKRETSRYFLFDDNLQLSGWENIKSNEIRIARPGIQPLNKLAFSGIQMIDPLIFPYIDQDGSFSIVDTYLKVAVNHTIFGYEHNPDTWVDMGKPDEIIKAENILNKLKNNS